MRFVMRDLFWAAQFFLWQDHFASVVEEVLGQTRSLVDSCAFAQQEGGNDLSHLGR